MQLIEDSWRRMLAILEALADGELSIYAIADKIGERRQTVSNYVAFMARMGLLTVRLEKTSPPRKMVRLTEKGRCLLSCMTK